MRTNLDHLVVLAQTLEDGAAWCRATLGVTPVVGGAHPDMGTHNRLFAIASERFAGAYCEILAIDPAAPAPGRPRWFDLDDPARVARDAARPPGVAAHRAR